MSFLKKPLEIFNFSAFLQTQILMLPVLMYFYEENGLTTGDLFLFQGIFSITALLFEIPAGYIGDIFPRRNVLIFSYGLFLARLILWSFFGGYWIVLAGEILYSLSKAFYSGVADGYVYDYLKSKQNTKKMLHGYGKLNFFMSIGTALASLIGAPLYKEFGFPVLIGIEIVLNTLAIGMLFMLPKVPSVHKKMNGFSEKYKELFEIAKGTFQHTQLRPYIFYSGIMAATTMVFVWSFQPLMKAVHLPVALFGVIYFINHAFRAGASILLPKTLALCPLPKLGKIAFVLYIMAFLFAVVMAHGVPAYIGMILLTFICMVIGFQLTFTLGHTSRLHTLVPSSIRSTVASVNNMVSRALAGIMLILFKFVFDDVSMTASFFIYMALFCISVIPLIQLLRLPNVTSVPETQTV